MPSKNSAYRAGYEYAKTLCLDKLPLDVLVEMLDGYKEVAVTNQSYYYHGMTKWMEEEILRREVPAA